MQEYAIEVESNILAVERLKGEFDRGVKDKKKKKEEKILQYLINNQHKTRLMRWVI